MVELKPPRGGRDRLIRLEAPLASASEPSTAGRRGVRWIAAIALIGLLGLAGAVLFVLPGLVEPQQAVYRGAPPADAVRTAEPEENAEPVEAPEPLAEPIVAAKRVEPRRPLLAPTPLPGRLSSKEERGPEKDPFVEAMSQGLAALDREGYAAARDAFLRAEALRPGSPESADGISRAEAGRRRTQLAALDEKAMAAEEAEDWYAAVEAYEAALKVDPTVSFARQGAKRARDRASLDERLRFHLSNAERLSSSEVLHEASLLLAKASELTSGGPRLLRQVEALGRLVDSYSQPVRVELRSDNLTEVTVYRVGRLGTFETRDLDLRPGTYTVVGSRNGYRDVRRRLVVEPGQEPAPFEVRCEEEI